MLVVISDTCYYSSRDQLPIRLLDDAMIIPIPCNHKSLAVWDFSSVYLTHWLLQGVD